jgi:hypothetical protein
MISDDSERLLDDGITLDAEPACTALVPLARTAQWSRIRPLPRPDSIFLSHLIADSEQAPQTGILRQASVSNANAAYTANWHRVAGTGLRPRQVA